ncbi:MAG: hypothetical protein WA771_11030, partial [Chthoniobacterales bacterium]
RGIDPGEIIVANEKIAPTPDLVILLDLPPESGLNRVRSRGDVPNSFEETVALTRAREIFLELHAAYPETSICIDATPSLRDVHTEARQAFESALQTRANEAAASKP